MARQSAFFDELAISGYVHETGVEKLMRDAKYLQPWPEPNWTAADAIVEAVLR